MLGKKYKNVSVIAIILLLLFAIGLILGTITLFYIPKETIEEARGMLNPTDKLNESFIKMFSENFFVEFLWIAVIWILSGISFMSSVTGAVLSIRGFVLGFSIAFSLTGNGDWVKFVTCYILPQCIFALPLMTVFSMICIINALEKKYREKQNASYFIKGALFTLLAAASSLAECWITRVFVSYL